MLKSGRDRHRELTPDPARMRSINATQSIYQRMVHLRIGEVWSRTAQQAVADRQQ